MKYAPRFTSTQVSRWLLLVLVLLFSTAALAAPSITTVSPTSGAVGASVTITGTGFGSTQGTSTVKFNGTTASATSWSSTSIVATVPSAATTGNIVVTVSGTASNGKSFTVVAAPNISTLSPTSGVVGTSITITGTNFGATQGSSTVKFNGTTATTITSWSATSIVVPVPSGATTGNVVVHASGVDSNGKAFTVNASPSIASLSPTSGAFGASVTVTGTNFGSTQGTSSLKFNGTTATPTSWSATSIVVPVPTGATTGNVVVTVNSVASNGSAFTVVSAPAITSLSPTSAAVGTSVTVTGTNFGSTQGTSTVKFNGTSGTPTSWSATSIAVPVPVGATTGNVVVHAAGVDSNGSAFTVLPAPSITSVSPTSVAIGGSVTITGANFGSTQGTSTVKFNTTTATSITSWSVTSIVATVPTGATSGNVIITVGGVASNGSPFSIVSAPSITSTSPTSGAAGASVTITGTNFGSTQGVSTVKFNGTSGTPTSWSAASIAVPVPSGASTGNIVVHAAGIDSNGKAFTVNIPPSITNLSPTSGGVGTSVTITGTNFGATQGTSTVKFNTTTATTITSWSATSIVATVPSGATTGNVVVTVNSLASNGVSFTVFPTPSISTLSPTSGIPGNTVTINGSNFGASQGTSTVTFNGITATSFTAWGATQIKAAVPNGATTGNVVVTVNGVASNGKSFTVTSPTITNLSPASGPVGTLVTISGTNFGSTQGTSTVKFNTTTASSFTSWSSTSIKVSVPIGATSGPITVTVGTLSGQSGTFTVTPAISWIYPPSGTNGTSVGIYGNNFGATQGTSTVNFNGVAANPSSWSDSKIVVPAPLGASTGPINLTVNGTTVQSVAYGITSAIQSISPASGPVGTPVTISGRGFGSAQGTSSVTFNGVAGTPSTWSDTLIVVPVPLGAMSGAVAVANSGFSSNSATFIVSDIPQSPQLQIHNENSPASVNLSDPANLDWIAWGADGATTNSVRKAGVPLLIASWWSLDNSCGSPPCIVSSAGNVKYNWTAGTPTGSGSDVKAGIQAYGSFYSYYVRVPADTNAQTLKIYTGVSGSVLLSASLTTNADPVNASNTFTSMFASRVFVIDFRADSPGQTLTITLTRGDAGSIGAQLQAATIQSHVPSVEILSPPDDQTSIYPNSQSVTLNASQFDQGISTVALLANGTEIFNGAPAAGPITWTPESAGHYKLQGTATDAAGLKGSSKFVEFDSVAGGGAVEAGVNMIASATSVNLTTEGTADWRLFQPAYNSPISASKAGVASLISYKTIGNSTDLYYANIPFAVSFTDGTTPPQSAGAILYAPTFYGVENGAELTVSADTTPRTLRLYAKGTTGRTKIKAFLSDGSSFPVLDGQINQSTNSTDGLFVYSVNFRAGSSGQTLTVRLTVESEDPQVSPLTLFAATLDGPPVNPHPEITKIDPQIVLASGVPVTIYGAGFGSSQGSSSVTFNGVAATINSWTDNTISVQVPGVSCGGPVLVNVNGASSPPFNFAIASGVTIAPNNQLLAINGSEQFHLVDSSCGVPLKGVSWSLTTKYCGGRATISEGSSSVATCHTGVDSPGSCPTSNDTICTSSAITAEGPTMVPARTGSVTLNASLNAGGTFYSVTKPISLVPVPTITQIQPTTAAPGEQVIISGSGLYLAPGATTVTFGGVPATVTQAYHVGIDEVFVTVPNICNGPIVVTVNGEYSSAPYPFSISQPISIHVSSPMSIYPGATAGIIAGQNVHLEAVGSTCHAPVSNVTWSITSANPANAAILSSGDQPVLTTTSAGQVMVNASFGSNSDSTAFSIAPSGPPDPVTTGTTDPGARFSSSQLTDSAGNQSTYGSVSVAGKRYVSSSTGSGCVSCSLRGSAQMTFDIHGNVASETDALGHTTNYSYDLFDNLLKVSRQVDANNIATTQYTYNKFSEVLTITDPLGNTTTNAYDAHGNLLAVTAPAPDANTQPSTTQFVHDSKGQLAQVIDPLGNSTTLTYTPTGLIETIVDAQQNTTHYEYDLRGNRTAVTDAEQNRTQFDYDLGNRLTRLTYADTSFVTFAYDSRGRRISSTNQNQKTTIYTYDDADRLINVKDAANNTSYYDYDDEDNLVRITDASGRQTSFDYDEFGNLKKTTYPSLLETYQYDAVGNLISKTDRKNQTIAFVYDALNRLIHKSYPDTTRADYVYDLAGKLRQVSDPSGTYGLAYDNMGRLIGATTQYSFLSGHTFANTYTYDAASNRTSFTGPATGMTSYQYDSLQRVASLSNTLTGAFTFGYDAMSWRTSLTRPNNVGTSYAYDNMSRLTSVSHKLNGTTVLDGAAYHYDGAGNPTSKTDYKTNTEEAYVHDALDQLTTVTRGGSTTEQYSYDAVRNRLSSADAEAYNYNVSNQLLSTSATTFTYDNNGNMFTRSGQNGQSAYAWDINNRLLSVTLAGSGGTVSFDYDPFGRRVRKRAPSGTTIYLYDGGNIVGETDSNGNPNACYVDGLGLDEPLAMIRNGQASYFNTDGSGSITSISNNVGSLIASYSTDTFGNILQSSGSVVNPFRYRGREWDAETGLYYYRARYYDPAIGRFISEDPVGFAEGTNFYAYVHNRVLVSDDPFGFAENSPSNLRKRTLIDKLARGYDGSTLWSFDAKRGTFAAKTNKCNKFVYDVTTQAGAEPKIKGRPKWPAPQAAEWANENVDIPNWRVLDPGEEPQPGDVAAYPLTPAATAEAPFTGHSGIVVSGPNGVIGSMSAHDTQVGPFRYDQFVQENMTVYRRYTGD